MGGCARAGAVSSLSMKVLLLLSMAVVAQTAAAFECSEASPEKHSSVWLQRCIPFYVQQDSTILLEQENAVRAALGSFTSVECTDLDLRYEGPTEEQLGRFRPDATPRNVLGVWPAEQFPDANLLSVSIVSYDLKTGVIVDADIALNASKTFGEVRDSSTCNDVYDLQSVLTRELLGALGFAKGTLRNACETEGRVLSDDEVDGLCTVYPEGLAVNPCVAPPSYDSAKALMSASCPNLAIAEAESGCGCRAASHCPNGGGPVTLLLTACGFGLLWRSRRSSFWRSFGG